MGVGPAKENPNTETTTIVDKRIVQCMVLVVQPRNTRSYAVLRILMHPMVNAFWFDIQLPLEPNGHAKDIDLADDLDARELEEDMKTAARTRLRFFGRCIARCTRGASVLMASIIVDTTQTASPYMYETLPGGAAVERRNQAYFNGDTGS